MLPVLVSLPMAVALAPPAMRQSRRLNPWKYVD
jgi:hypothetical protein